MPFNVLASEAKCEDLERVIVGNDPEKFFQVGAQLPLQEREQLIEFLRKNIDVFAWSAYVGLIGNVERLHSCYAPIPLVVQLPITRVDYLLNPESGLDSLKGKG